MKRGYNCRKPILWDRTFVGTHKILAYWNNCETLCKYHLTDAKYCMVHLLLLPAFLHPALGRFLMLALRVWVPTLLASLGLCSLGGNLEVCSGTNICTYCSISIKKKKKNKCPKPSPLFSVIAITHRLWPLWQKPLSEGRIVGNDFSIIVWLWVQIFMGNLTIEFKTQDKAAWYLMVARKKSDWTAEFAAGEGVAVGRACGATVKVWERPASFCC